MEARKAATDVLAAVNVLEHARKACSNLKPLDAPMSDAELIERARIIDTVVRTRKLLARIQDRADHLGEALERFKQRREAMRA
ncbi:MAG: hypothetical protein EOP90_15380 [Lysobacteraceae bacterium]|jgi:hypothetical protein|nr:MAG: hypothetical protein EOP90_15380 [Xanthomonadaceae bacterium]